jgi:signal peptide peptidase SppA
MPEMKNEDSKKYHHVVKELHRPWAILPNTFRTICDIVRARISGEIRDNGEVEAKATSRQRQVIEPYNEGAIRVIPVQGIIAKRMNLFIEFSGGVSTEILQRDIGEALDDNSVVGILLDIDSPGGSVDGPFEISDFLFENRGKKPVVAFANGMMCSAAYLIGSASDYLITSQAAQNGSIGVVTVHEDWSKFDEELGVKRTILHSGEYKTVGHDAAPLSDRDREVIQEGLDYYYSMFVDAVARNREMGTESTLKMADGRIFVGEQGLPVGLIDELGTYETSLQTVTSLLTNTGIKQKKGARKMELKELLEKLVEAQPSVDDLALAFPDFVEHYKQLGIEESEKGYIKQGREMGEDEERTRITEILEAKADPEVTLKAIKNGTPAADFYKLAYDHMRGVQDDKLKKLVEETVEHIGPAEPQDVDVPDLDDAHIKVAELATKLAKEEKIDMATATNRVLNENPKLKAEYLATFNS